MSIHPEYSERILRGTKQVEFRKRRIAEDVTHIIVYATAPVSAVVGAFSVVDQHTITPPSLWQRFRHVAGIGKQDFLSYYSGYATGTGIVVGEALRPPEPLCLQGVLGIARPPQSYQYLSAEIAHTTLSVMTPSMITT